MVGTMYGTKEKGVRYLEMTEGYCTQHGARRRRPGDRLRVRLPRQNDGLHQEGHGAERGLREVQRHTTAASRRKTAPSSASIRVLIGIRRRRTKNGYILKAMRGREAAAPRRFWRKYGISTTLTTCKAICDNSKGVDAYTIVQEHPAHLLREREVGLRRWAPRSRSRRALKTAADGCQAASASGLQAFCIPGSVADNRKVGLGHGNLGQDAALG